MTGKTKRGNARRKKKHGATAEQRCRARRCQDCGAPPPSTVHHEPPKSAIGWTKHARILTPLCRACHDKRHDMT